MTVNLPLSERWSRTLRGLRPRWITGGSRRCRVPTTAATRRISRVICPVRGGLGAVPGAVRVRAGGRPEVGAVGVGRCGRAGGCLAVAGGFGRGGGRVIPVAVRQCLHLKTACTALPDGVLLVNPAWLEMTTLRGFNFVAVSEEEPLAADILPIGRRVCVPAENVRTADLIRQRGFEVETVDLSEFAKAEGGVTCLSILFRRA